MLYLRHVSLIEGNAHRIYDTDLYDMYISYEQYRKISTKKILTKQIVSTGTHFTNFFNFNHNMDKKSHAQ